MLTLGVLRWVSFWPPSKRLSLSWHKKIFYLPTQPISMFFYWRWVCWQPWIFVSTIVLRGLRLKNILCCILFDPLVSCPDFPHSQKVEWTLAAFGEPFFRTARALLSWSNLSEVLVHKRKRTPDGLLNYKNWRLPSIHDSHKSSMSYLSYSAAVPLVWPTFGDNGSPSVPILSCPVAALSDDGLDEGSRDCSGVLWAWVEVGQKWRPFHCQLREVEHELGWYVFQDVLGTLGLEKIG